MSNDTAPEGYRVHREYRFTINNGEEIAVTLNNGEEIHLEETRKNGQEDCHMSGELRFVDGKWQWSEEWGRQYFDRYGNEGLADGILAHINKYPPPRT